MSAYTPLCDDAGSFLRWLEVGTGQMDIQGNLHIHLDRMPTDPDAFTGYVRLSPPGTLPPKPTKDELSGL